MWYLKHVFGILTLQTGTIVLSSLFIVRKQFSRNDNYFNNGYNSMFSDAGYMCFICERIGPRHRTATYENILLFY